MAENDPPVPPYNINLQELHNLLVGNGNQNNIGDLPDDPQFLHSSDHSSLILISDPLTEKNFSSWNRAITIALEARDKMGFLNGEIHVPDEQDPMVKQWRRVNSTLISWLLNTISPNLISGFMYARIAKLIWDDIRERFGKTNGAKVFELKKSICSAKHGSDSVNVYYNKLMALWDELATVKPTCVDDDEDKMMQFLMGLNDDYEAIRN